MRASGSVTSAPGPLPTRNPPIHGRGTIIDGLTSMDNLNAVEIKAFVPARDFTLSKQFCNDLGFTIAWSDDDPAYLHLGRLQFFAPEFLQAGARGQLHDAPARRRRGGMVATCGECPASGEVRGSCRVAR